MGYETLIQIAMITIIIVTGQWMWTLAGLGRRYATTAERLLFLFHLVSWFRLDALACKVQTDFK